MFLLNLIAFRHSVASHFSQHNNTPNPNLVLYIHAPLFFYQLLMQIIELYSTKWIYNIRNDNNKVIAPHLDTVIYEPYHFALKQSSSARLLKASRIGKAHLVFL